MFELVWDDTLAASAQRFIIPFCSENNMISNLLKINEMLLEM
jgi:hypothetical protein